MAKNIYRKITGGQLKKITQYGGILFVMLTDLIRGKSFNVVAQVRITPHRILTEADIIKAITSSEALADVEFNKPELWVMGKYEIFTVETQYGFEKDSGNVNTTKPGDLHAKVIATKTVEGVQTGADEEVAAGKGAIEVKDVRIISTKKIMAFQESGSQEDRTSTEEILKQADDLSSKN